MITIAVPPGLPACLALAMCIAMWRLRKAAIHVSVPHKLPLAGDIDTCLFDKTGTLTEPGKPARLSSRLFFFGLLFLLISSWSNHELNFASVSK